MISLDAMSRPAKEMVVKTTCGGYLSMVSIFSIALLVFSEWRNYSLVELKDEIVIGRDQDTDKIRMFLNVTFHKIPCEGLSINVQDAHGANVPVSHKVWKWRLNKDGHQIARPIRSSPRHVASEPQSFGQMLNVTDEKRSEERRQVHPTARKRCSSCYLSSEIVTDTCCNSCESVAAEQKVHSAKFDKDEPKSFVVDQCVEKEVYKIRPPEPDEGCKLLAKMSLTKRQSSEVMIGVNANFRSEFLHPTVYDDLKRRKVDMSHEIHHMNFGPSFPGFVAVLDGREKEHGPFNEDRLADQFEYEVNLIPTVYEPLTGPKISSNQYSVIEHSQRVSLFDDGEEVGEDSVSVGLFLLIRITAFEIRWREFQKPITQFLIALCAVVGGIFASAGLIDNLVYRFSQATIGDGRKLVH